MNNKVCFLFGHSTAPEHVRSHLQSAIQQHYADYGIRTFIVGNRGRFDQMAAAELRALKQHHNDVTLLLLLAYHPADRSVVLPWLFDGSYYPPLEGVPRRFAIVQANRHMVKTADSLICYVSHPGNSRSLLEFAQRKRPQIHIENVAAMCYNNIKIEKD